MIPLRTALPVLLLVLAVVLAARHYAGTRAPGGEAVQLGQPAGTELTITERPGDTVPLIPLRWARS